MGHEHFWRWEGRETHTESVLYHNVVDISSVKQTLTATEQPTQQSKSETIIEAIINGIFLSCVSTYITLHWGRRRYLFWHNVVPQNLHSIDRSSMHIEDTTASVRSSKYFPFTFLELQIGQVSQDTLFQSWHSRHRCLSEAIQELNLPL